MIRLNNISAGYLSETVLSGFSFRAGRGELVGIFGPNGAGKTTMLCAVNGLARLTEGEVLIGGIQLGRSTASGIRKRIGYVPQYFEIDSRVPASAGEVALMGTYGRKGILRPPGAREKNRLGELAGIFGIEHLLGKPFGQLSGGEKQKTLTARALMQEPEILLLDEIFAWLDTQAQEDILELIEKLHHQNNLTTLIVSHNAVFIRDIITRAVRLEAGKIIFDGKPEDAGIPPCCTT